MKKNTMFGLLTISLCFTAGCGSLLNVDSLVWIDPIDGGTDGSVPDSGNPDSGLPDSGNPDGGPDSGTDGGPPDGGGDAGVNPCIPNPCMAPNKAICNPNGAQFTCSCNAGYHDVSGNCVQDQTCLPNSCGGHGACSNPGGVVTCSCDLGYQPPVCGTCSTDWQDNDSNGSCLMACSNPSLVLNCNGHGNCLDTSGTSVCSCSNPWTGSDCNTCPAGFYVNGGAQCVDDPCLPNVCQNGGTCSRPAGTAVCACAGNWNPATNCSSCLIGFGGANCDPIATLTVTQTAGASTTLTNTAVVALRFRIVAAGGTASIARMTFSTALTGSAQINGQTLYRNGLVSTSSLTRSAGRIVVVNSAEDQVVPGTPNDYILELTIGGAATGNTLTVALLGDSAATPTMVGSSGYVYNSVGSTLFTSATGLCGTGTPNFVWAGLAHTAPTPTCNITAFGTSDYATGFEAGTWSVSNTLTAP